MTKHEAVDWLKAKGYTARLDDGVVMVTAPEGADTMQIAIAVRMELLKQGYGASMGVRAAEGGSI